MPLVIVPTPIGNLEDITLRAIRILREAELIACEDTRRTAILLQNYSIRTKTISYHSFNEKERAENLIARLKMGETVALVSDAGTPGICDPGHVIINQAIQEGIPVTVLPGACAAVTALVASGFSSRPFFFGGFLPDKIGERRRFLQSLVNYPWVLIFYISPHKAFKHLSSILEVLGNRKAVLCREMSKIYEETHRSDLAQMVERSRTGGIRGEIVLVIDAVDISMDEQNSIWQGETNRLYMEGLSEKTIVNLVTDRFPIPRNVVKRYMADLKKLDKDEPGVL